MPVLLLKIQSRAPLMQRLCNLRSICEMRRSLYNIIARRKLEVTRPSLYFQQQLRKLCIVGIENYESHFFVNE